VTAHMVRVDPEDNIWTADIGSHVVLKLSAEGRVLLALGRMRSPETTWGISTSLPMSHGIATVTCT